MTSTCHTRRPQKNAVALEVQDNAIQLVLYIALEVSNKQFKLVLADGMKRRRTMEAGDLATVCNDGGASAIAVSMIVGPNAGVASRG